DIILRAAVRYNGIRLRARNLAAGRTARSVWHGATITVPLRDGARRAGEGHRATRRLGLPLKPAILAAGFGPAFLRGVGLRDWIGRSGLDGFRRRGEERPRSSHGGAAGCRGRNGGGSRRAVMVLRARLG